MNITKLLEFGMEVVYNYDYVGPVGPERKRVEYRDQITDVKFPFTEIEWCSLCMRDGESYIGGCCGKASAIQDHLNAVFRDGGWIQASKFQNLVELFEAHPETGDMFALKKVSQQELDEHLSRWDTFGVFDKLAICWLATKDNLLVKTQGHTPQKGTEFDQLLTNTSCLTTAVHLHRYSLPSTKGSGWAIIVLGSDGYFSAVSDYGNYAYMWRDHGCKDFRQFLLRASRDWDYFCKKLNPVTQYDHDKTLKCVQETVNSAVVDGTVTQAEADKELLRIKTYYNYLYDEDSFNSWVADSELSYIDSSSLRCTSYDSQVVGFVQKTMARLSTVLEKELEAEGITNDNR